MDGGVVPAVGAAKRPQDQAKSDSRNATIREIVSAESTGTI